MDKIERNGVSVKLKRDALTAGQVTSLVKEVIKIYTDGQLLKGYSFNPVDMEINFYAGLFLYTVDEYNNTDDNEEFEKLFKAGIHKEILEKVENAQLAYDLMWKTANEVGNSVGLILDKVSKLIDTLPEQGDLTAMMDKLPEEWNTVKKEYDEIMRVDAKKDKENKKEGEKK